MNHDHVTHSAATGISFTVISFFSGFTQVIHSFGDQLITATALGCASALVHWLSSHFLSWVKSAPKPIEQIKDPEKK